MLLTKEQIDFINEHFFRFPGCDFCCGVRCRQCIFNTVECIFDIGCPCKLQGYFNIGVHNWPGLKDLIKKSTKNRAVADKIVNDLIGQGQDFLNCMVPTTTYIKTKLSIDGEVSFAEEVSYKNKEGVTLKGSLFKCTDKAKGTFYISWLKDY